MRRNGRIAFAVLLMGGSIAMAPATTQAADRSRAMDAHMRLMQAGNPGMDRMMELMAQGNPGMSAMMSAPPFQGMP